MSDCLVNDKNLIPFSNLDAHEVPFTQMSWDNTDSFWEVTIINDGIFDHRFDAKVHTGIFTLLVTTSDLANHHVRLINGTNNNICFIIFPFGNDDRNFGIYSLGNRSNIIYTGTLKSTYPDPNATYTKTSLTFNDFFPAYLILCEVIF